MPNVEAILNEALQLPLEERALIAERLISSLEPTPDPSVEAAWQAEIDRRLRELDGNTVECIPWERVREQLRRETGFAN
jgi:putative addiction module component (TIGR02574 family)